MVAEFDERHSAVSDLYRRLRGGDYGTRMGIGRGSEHGRFRGGSDDGGVLVLLLLLLEHRERHSEELIGGRWRSNGRRDVRGRDRRRNGGYGLCLESVADVELSGDWRLVERGRAAGLTKGSIKKVFRFIPHTI